MTYDFSYIYPEMEEETRKQASVKRRLDRELSCACYEEAYVLPSKDLWKDGKCFGGVVTSDNTFVEASAWHEGARCDKYEFEKNDVIDRDEVVIYLGFYNGCWGHAITDNLKKLWYLKTEECCGLLHKGAKIIYLTIDNSPQPEHVYRLFELAGVDLNSFELVTDISLFKKVYVPDNSFIAAQGQRLFTREYVEIIDLIKQNAVQGSTLELVFPSKIYFTRTRLKSPRDFGEKTIERLFEKKGYKIIAPEEHSVDEQILYLMHCNHFAATEGSISHNAVFCQKGTKVVIVRKCYDVNKYQMAVNEVADVDVDYIDSHHSTKVPKDAPWVGPFYLYPNSNLLSWSHIGLFVWPHYARLSWFLYLFQDTRIFKAINRRINIV